MSAKPFKDVGFLIVSLTSWLLGSIFVIVGADGKDACLTRHSLPSPGPNLFVAKTSYPFKI